MSAGAIVRTGTSGFSYKEWKGSFYPEAIAAGDMLAYYAGQLGACEINSTFYRMPRASVLEGWDAQTPDAFRFVLKASRRITHFKRLKPEKDVGEDVAYFLSQAAALGPHLGAVLFQLPPNLKKDLPRLRAFLELLPGEARAAFEFRHASWLDDEVFDALREHGAALCIAQTDEATTPVVATAPWGYLRLRKQVYEPGELDGWAERIGGQDWAEVFVFFKHEDGAAGPRLAREFALRFAG
ncbi:MAG TPA: DUF72 domain-containing protein [Longimicrobiales bacterium]|nr:DUF72 domain-containing protein [Longimicrobiales bacterium]